VLVLPPPIRQIGMPTSVGACEDLMIDLTRCFGYANRGWTTNLLSIQMVTGVFNPTSPLNRTQAFISSVITAGQWRIVIPNSYLTAGASYRLTLSWHSETQSTQSEREVSHIFVGRHSETLHRAWKQKKKQSSLLSEH
jgi:hypothetical protein